MYYPSQRLSVLAFVFTTKLNKNEALITHQKRVPFSFDHANCISVREYIYFVGTSVYVTVRSMKTLASSLRCKNAQKSESLGSQHGAGELKGFSVAILPSICLSSGMNICGVAVFSHSRQFLYSFIKINFTWMSDLICCHKQFRLQIQYINIYIYYCAMENKCKTNHNMFCLVFSFCPLICALISFFKEMLY